MIRWHAIAWIVLAFLGCSRSPDRSDTVILWHAYTGDERTALEEAVAGIAEEDGIHVDLVSVPYEAFADKITNAIPNGNGPDLFIFAHDRVGDWVSTGLVEPIEYWVDEQLADRFAYDALAAMSYGSSLYGLPIAVKCVALFHRTDLVPDAPRDTAALRAVGERLRRDRPGTYALAYENVDLYAHAAWLHGFGGHIFADSGELDLATPGAIAALRFAREIGAGDGALVPPEMTGTMVATLFNAGKAAMAISGPWMVADIADDVPWRVTTLPVVSATGDHAAPFLGAEGVLMSARARDKGAAFRVMNALTADAAATARARRARQVVPNLASYADPQVRADPVLSAFRAQLDHAVPMPATPQMRMVWTPYKSALQKAVVQGGDPAAALRAAEGEVREYIEGAGLPGVAPVPARRAENSWPRAEEATP